MPNQILLLGNGDAAFALKPVFEAMHAVCTHADSVEEFALFLSRRSFDLCIFDHDDLFTADAKELFQCSQALDENHIPTLLLSLSPQDDMKYFIRLPIGLFDMMTPPYFPEMILRKIQNILAYSDQHTRLKEEIRRRKKAEKATQTCEHKFREFMVRLARKLSVLSSRNLIVKKKPLEAEVY